MQNRYAGDIGDYGKFALLRALAAEGFSIGVNWYLVETPPRELAVNDGGKFIPDTLTSCDPALADALREISHGPDRSVAALERASLVPNARYYDDMVPVADREEWHARALSALDGADIVFLDPDNGLLVKSVGKRSAKAPKYAFYEEVAGYVARGQSVLVYNHRSRKKAEDYFGEIYERLAAAVSGATDISAITFHKGSVRDYFAISANSDHAAKIRVAFNGFVDGIWDETGMCELQQLPAGSGRMHIGS